MKAVLAGVSLQPLDTGLSESLDMCMWQLSFLWRGLQTLSLGSLWLSCSQLGIQAWDATLAPHPSLCDVRQVPSPLWTGFSSYNMRNNDSPTALGSDKDSARWTWHKAGDQNTLAPTAAVFSLPLSLLLSLAARDGGRVWILALWPQVRPLTWWGPVSLYAKRDSNLCPFPMIAGKIKEGN